MLIRRLRASLRVTAAVAVVALAVGCGSDAPTTPSSGSSLDLDSVFAQMSAGGSALAAAGALAGVPATPASPTVLPSACTYSAGTQDFVCPTKTVNGLTFALTYYLYDGSGHAQSAADVKTTDGVRTVTDLTGTTSLPSTGPLTGTNTISSHSDMTLKGLLGTTRTLNGTSQSHFDVTTTGTTSSHTTNDVTTTTANVILPKPGSASAWPLSGTITADVANTTVVGTSSLVLNLHSVITFNGTSIVSIATTVGGHTATCKIDLTGKTAPVC